MESARNVFVYPCDSYVGNAVGELFAEGGCLVSGGRIGVTVPGHVSTSYQVGSADDSTELRHCLMTADVVVYDMFSNEQATKDALLFLLQQPYGGREVVFVAVSSPLVWANTPPMLASGEGEDDAGSGKHAPFTQQEFSTRRPSAAGRTAYQTEQLILQSSRPGRLCTYVVCPGLLYGSGEASHTFFAWAKTAWEMQPGRLPCTAGPGANILPTTHVRDLAAYVASLATFQPIKDTSLSSTLTRTTGVLSTMGRTAGRPATAAAANPNASLAGRGPEHRYFLVADAGRSTQVQLAEAFSKALGSGEVTSRPATPATDLRSELLLLDLRMVTTQLPGTPNNTTAVLTSRGSSPSQQLPYEPKYQEGPIFHIDALAKEFIQAHNLSPLRVLLMGPPMAGKTVLAHRLAKQYGLQYIGAKELLAAVEAAPPELAKAVQAEMARPTEARASSASLAALLKQLAHPEGPAGRCNATVRGFVLDAFPKSLTQARFAFGMLEQLTEAEAAAKAAAAEAAAAAAAAAGADAAPAKDAKGKDAKAAPAKDAKAAKGAPPPVVDVFEVPPGMKVVPDPLLVPTHVLELVVTEEDLRARLDAVAALESSVRAAEAGAAAAADPKAGGKDAKGAKGKGKPDGAGAGQGVSHNTEADFTRRMEAYAKAQEEDAADLKERQAIAKAAWEVAEKARVEEEARRDADAATLKAKRRRAREAAAAAMAATGSPNGSAGGAILAGIIPGFGPGVSLAQTFGLTLQEGSAPGSPALAGTGSYAEEAGSPLASFIAHGAMRSVAPPLPGFGGVVGLCKDGGAVYVRLENPTLETGPALTAALGLPAGSEFEVSAGKAEELELHDAEAALQGAVGTPHNFDGFPQPPPRPPTPADEAAMVSEAARVQAVAEAAALAERTRALSVAGSQAQSALQALLSDDLTAPLLRVLTHRVLPTVVSALTHIASTRPAAPLLELAEALSRAADTLDGESVDPYSDPQYEIQVHKIEAKKARVEARAAAEAEKQVQRERNEALAAAAAAAGASQ